MKVLSVRRIGAVLMLALALIGYVVFNPDSYEAEVVLRPSIGTGLLANEALEQLDIKGRAPRTGYVRDEFYSNWGRIDGCDVRNVILKRDMWDVVLDGCVVESGSLNCPYTAQTIHFVRGPGTSSLVQIDHVVSLSDAWQKGAQQLSRGRRREFANDPLNLIASDGPANQQKGDHDAASWLPPNRAFRCEFVARQIAIKLKYELWVTQSEYDAMANVLRNCPDERLIEDPPSRDYQ